MLLQWFVTHNRAMPLVKEPGFSLSVLPEQEVAKRPAVGVRVQSKGHRDIDLYFDKESGLLVKTESRILDKAQQEVVLEQGVGGLA